MKLKLFLLSFFSLLTINNAFAKNDIGIRTIVMSGKVKCGTDISAKAYADRDSDGYWHGYAVDWCKVFAKAILNKSDAFEMVNVSDENIETAFAQNKIDIMIGSNALSAGVELKSRAIDAGVILYENQGVLVRKKEGANSLNDYKGEKMCVVVNSVNLHNIQRYIEKYNLDISILPTLDRNKSKEAFMLKRCSMISGEMSYLISLHKNYLDDKDTYQVVPEKIAVKPLYVYVKKNNQKLRTLTKWIINTMQMAESSGVNSQNINIIIGTKSDSLRNILGDNDKIWKNYGLVNPKWAREAIKEFGNFGEIFDNNFGKNTIYNFERGENQPIENGGLIIPQPFL